MPIKLQEKEDQTAYLNGLALLSQIFWGPTVELCRDMVGPGFSEELSGLARVLDQTGRLAVSGLADFLAGYHDAEELQDGLETEYVSLFISDRSGIKAPLYASFYESDDGLLMGGAALRMKQRLEASGLSTENLEGHPPDHLSVELEYLFLLMEKALAEDNPDLAEEARSFAQQELKSWVFEFANRLDSDPERPFFPTAARLALSLIELAAGA